MSIFCMRACVWRLEINTGDQSFCSCLPPCSVRQGLSLSLEFADLTSELWGASWFSPECWDYMSVMLGLAFTWDLRTDLGSSCTQGKDLTDWAISSVPCMPSLQTLKQKIIRKCQVFILLSLSHRHTAHMMYGTLLLRLAALSGIILPWWCPGILLIPS